MSAARLASLVGPLGVVWGLKAAHGGADAARFEWLLRPTAWLVSALTGARFERTPGEGYLSRADSYVLAPSCAGLNFLLAAFLTLAFLFTWRRPLPVALPRLLASLLGAWALTVVVNTVRITLALALHHRPALAARLPLGADDAHRWLGVLVYAGALFALHAALSRRPVST